MQSVVASDVGNMLLSVQMLESTEEAIQFLKKVDALKVALDSVDAFFKQAVKFAQLEVAALLRVIELGGLSKLKGVHGEVANWLSSLEDDEKMKYINMCCEGITIDEVYKREIKPSITAERKIKYAMMSKDEAIKEYDKCGMVDIKKYEDEIRRCVPTEKYGTMANDFIDGLRRELRKNDAIGCGDGLYVSRNIDAHPLGVNAYKKAMEIRYKSLWNDIFSMLDIVSAAGQKISRAEFATHYKNSSFYEYEKRLLLLLADIGIFE